jgi:hypothetical protein
LKYATSLLDPIFGQIELLHVIPSQEESAGAGQCQAAYEYLCKQNVHPNAIRQQVLHGTHIAQAIVNEAERSGTDLIVMRTKRAPEPATGGFVSAGAAGNVKWNVAPRPPSPLAQIRHELLVEIDATFDPQPASTAGLIDTVGRLAMPFQRVDSVFTPTTPRLCGRDVNVLPCRVSHNFYCDAEHNGW